MSPPTRRFQSITLSWIIPGFVRQNLARVAQLLGASAPRLSHLHGNH
jgi:hypothetical protein